MGVLEQDVKAFPESQCRFEKARQVIAGGITHDGKFLRPFPVSIARARGSHKWDVDGHDLIDYWMGHGSMLLGHGHPAIVQAIQEQAARGSHYGASHDLEVEWAGWIMMRTMGMLSAAHSQADLERTVGAFDATLDLLVKEGAIAG